MLQFYNFVDNYTLFEYCEMVTDSAYFVLVGDSVNDLVTRTKRATRGRPVCSR